MFFSKINTPTNPPFILIFLIKSIDNVTNYYFWLIYLPTGQLAGHAGPSRGVTAVVHGWFFMHWATIWIKSREHLQLPTVGWSERNEIHQTSCSIITFVAPIKWELDSIVMAIQLSSNKDDICQVNILQFTMIYFTAYHINGFNKLL